MCGWGWGLRACVHSLYIWKGQTRWARMQNMRSEGMLAFPSAKTQMDVAIVYVLRLHVFCACDGIRRIHKTMYMRRKQEPWEYLSGQVGCWWLDALRWAAIR